MQETPYSHRTLDELKVLKSEAESRKEKLKQTIEAHGGTMNTAQDICMRNTEEEIWRIDHAIRMEYDFEDSL